jgi:hypothetical protein
MVRLNTDRRTDDAKPSSMTWDGTAATAAKIIEWSRDIDGQVRFQWRAGVHEPDQARTRIDHPPVTNTQGFEIERGQSTEWRVTPVGSVIAFADDSVGSPLVLEVPVKPEDVFDQ